MESPRLDVKSPDSDVDGTGPLPVHTDVVVLSRSALSVRSAGVRRDESKLLTVRIKLRQEPQ